MQDYLVAKYQSPLFYKTVNYTQGQKWPSTSPSDLYKAFRSTLSTLPFSGFWGPVPRPNPVSDSSTMSTSKDGFDDSSFGDMGYGYPTSG